MYNAITLLFIMAICGHVCAQEGPSSEQSDKANAPAATVAVDQVSDDSSIRERLIKIFDAASKAGWFTEAEVILDSGIVTLKGQADNEDHRQWAENVARKTQDVVEVINELTVDNEVDLESTKDVVATSMVSLWTDFLIRSPLLIVAMFLLLLTGILAKILGWTIHRVLDKRRLRSSLKDLINQLSVIGIWIVGFMVATIVAFPGMTPAKALTVLGLGSVAIGFAFKDIFENFFAGVLILWRYPFDRGDFITCADVTGEVNQITIRNTIIRRMDGELAIVPNTTLFKNTIDVLTSQPQRRVRIVCGIAYGEDVDKVREVIREAVQACDSVQGKRTVEVFAHEFASSSINFEVAWWTGSKPIDTRRSRDEVVAAIKRALDETGIEIPFPYRTLTFKDPKAAGSIKQQIQT